MNTEAQTTNHPGIAGERLKSYVDRIVRLKEEVAGLNDDIKDIKLEAKGTGFDTKILMKMVKETLTEREKVREEQELTDIYRAALGMEV